MISRVICRLDPTGRFLIYDVIKQAEGAFCKLTDAVCKKDNTHCVAKFPSYSTMRPDHDYLEKEVASLQHLRACKRVVKIIGTFHDTREGLLRRRRYLKHVECTNQRHIVIVMEKLKGGSLIHRIQARKDQGYRFTERSAAKIFRSFIKALHQVHKNGIIHCDLKLENAMFSKEQMKSNYIKIIDFGFSHHLWDNEEVYYNKPHGTLRFMAPETLNSYYSCSQAVYSKGSDIWQAACILTFLLTGDQEPFPLEMHHQAGVDFRAPVDTINTINRPVRGTVAKNPLKLAEAMGVSSAAQDLLKALFHEDPKKRLTTAQILEHEWFQDIANLPNIDYIDRLCPGVTTHSGKPSTSSSHPQSTASSVALPCTLANVRVDAYEFSSGGSGGGFTASK